MIKLTDIDKQQIEDAIHNLEKTTSGEVVVYIAKQSHNYKKGIWIISALFAVLAMLTIYVLGYFWLLSHQFGVDETILITLAAMIFGGMLTAFIKPIRLFFIDKSDVDEEVMQKAQGVFISEEVFSTKDRTGILIFISQLEHKVVVLGDKGINEKINQSDWDDILQLVISGVKTKSLTPKLVEAISLCEKLLLNNGFNVRKDDVDELSNHVRIEY